MANYAVVRTDRMFGTDNRAGLVSALYMGSGSTATAIENGNVVLLDGVIGDATNGYERELFVAKTPSANSAITDIGLVATPELKADPLKKPLHEFINEAGQPIRVYRLHSGDVFSVTKNALDTTALANPAVGNGVELMAGTKLKAIASPTQGSTVVGLIIGIETVGQYTYYVIAVD